MTMPSVAVGVLSLGMLLFWSGAIFAGTVAPTNTLMFSEKLSDKLVCSGNRAEGWSCDVLTGDGFTISAKILLSGVVITNFDEDTFFDLNVGDFDISYSLREDTKYVPGKTSATFIETYIDDNDKEHVYQTTHLKWTAKQLTVTITAKSSDIYTSFMELILADSFYDNDSGPITDTISDATVDFGSASVTFDLIAVTGAVVAKDRMAKDGEDYSLSTIKIMGRGLGVSQ